MNPFLIFHHIHEFPILSSSNNFHNTLDLDQISEPENHRDGILEKLQFPSNPIPQQFICLLSYVIMDKPVFISNDLKKVHLNKEFIASYIRQNGKEAKNPFNRKLLTQENLIEDTVFDTKIEFFIRTLIRDRYYWKPLEEKQQQQYVHQLITEINTYIDKQAKNNSEITITTLDIKSFQYEYDLFIIPLLRQSSTAPILLLLMMAVLHKHKQEKQQTKQTKNFALTTNSPLLLTWPDKQNANDTALQGKNTMRPVRNT